MLHYNVLTMIEKKLSEKDTVSFINPKHRQKHLNSPFWLCA